MNRRVEVVPLEGGYLVKAWCKTAPEAEAVQSAIVRTPKAEAFIPALSAGPAFDSPEVVMPPNCDGNAQFGHEATQAGYALAHAQHEAATDGDDCTSGACLITRGSD